MAHRGRAPRDGIPIAQGNWDKLRQGRRTVGVAVPGTIEAVLVSITPKLERPKWLRAPAPAGDNYHDLKALIDRLRLHTVCESAACPNVGECWNQRTATFMILGNVCTRALRLLRGAEGRAARRSITTSRARVAEAVAAMGLKFAVITSVNRDDRPTAAPSCLPMTIQAIRERIPGCGVEVLMPDFQGNARGHRDRDGAAARRPQSQHRDGAAPLPPGASGRALRAFARPAGARASESRPGRRPRPA